MIYDIGCPLSISQLAQIIDRMQNSEQYRKLAFSMNTGRKGGVLVENKLNRFKVNLCKSIYDSHKIPGRYSHNYQLIFQNAGRGTERIWGEVNSSPQPTVINWPGLIEKLN